MRPNVHVIGAGAWGTALALASLRAETHVTLHVRSKEQADLMMATRHNNRYLPGVVLPMALDITADFQHAQKADVILLVTPAQSLVSVLKDFHVPAHIPVVICAKGLEIKPPHRLMTEIAKEYLKNPLVVLSGPNFAHEIAQNLPAATTLAGDADVVEMVSRCLHSSHLRCYHSDDVIGVQVGGSIKNVLAIAAGVIHGMNLGANAAAALLSRGLMEMRRLGLALGAQGDTFLGLSGVGDLILTTSSLSSRNFSLGVALGQGLTLPQVLSQRVSVTEGVFTAQAVHALASRLDLQMPICQTIYQILYENLPLQQAMEQLMNRPQAPEIH